MFRAALPRKYAYGFKLMDARRAIAVYCATRLKIP